jgi:hypothetical protein
MAKLFLAISEGQNMDRIFAIGLSALITIPLLYACSEERSDPCQLLTADEVRSVDGSVVYSSWAGREGAKEDDEVCMYNTVDDEPRVMLFVWYDKTADPRTLVDQSSVGDNTKLVDLEGIGTKAAAVFSGQELKLLAVQSAEGVVGVRVRKVVTRDSAGFVEVVELVERALSRIK